MFPALILLPSNLGLLRYRMDQFKLQISGWKKELEQLQDCDVQSEIDQVNASLRATVAEITEAEDQTTMAAERKQQTHREVKG